MVGLPTCLCRLLRCLSGRRGKGFRLSEGGADLQPALHDGVGVFPGFVDPDADPAGAAGDAGGTVQHEIAERRDLGVSEQRRVGETEDCGPAHQIGGGEQRVQPGGVLGEPAARQVPRSRGFRFADAVFDPGVLTVVEFQPGGLATDDPVGDVGDERGDPMPIDISKGEPRTGMGTFRPHDHLRPFRPGGQVQQAGDSSNPGTFADRAITVDSRFPALVGDLIDDGLDTRVHGEPEGRTTPHGPGRLGRTRGWRRRSPTGRSHAPSPVRPDAA